MNLMINGLPKVSFKAIGSVNQVQNQQPQLATQMKQDTFEKSDTKSETKVPVLNTSTQTSVSKFSKPKYTQTDIFYINDNHGRIGNMSRIYSAKELYDHNNQNSSHYNNHGPRCIHQGCFPGTYAPDHSYSFPGRPVLSGFPLLCAPHLPHKQNACSAHLSSLQRHNAPSDLPVVLWRQNPARHH